VQHSEEERGRREEGGESEVVEAGGGHLKLAGSGASSPLPPAPSTYLACDCACGAVRCFGSNARFYAVWATTVGMRSQFCAEANGIRMFAAPLVSLRGAAAAALEGHEKGIPLSTWALVKPVSSVWREPPAFRLSFA
jgi:hypothetical protein